jgi:hypothetical protein
MTPYNGHPHYPGHHPYPSHFTLFFNPYPFFYSPFFYPTYPWWGFYPPLTFSDLGCPYEDYNFQQQPYYYQPEQGPSEQGSTGEAEQPSESTEEAPNTPSEEPQAQSAPFTYEKPLPDVIEWGKASAAGPESQPAPPGKGPLIVNLPHHGLTILLNDPDALTASTRQPAPPDSH